MPHRRLTYAAGWNDPKSRFIDLNGSEFDLNSAWTLDSLAFSLDSGFGHRLFPRTFRHFDLCLGDRLCNHWNLQGWCKKAEVQLIWSSSESNLSLEHLETKKNLNSASFIEGFSKVHWAYFTLFGLWITDQCQNASTPSKYIKYIYIYLNIHFHRFSFIFAEELAVWSGNDGFPAETMKFGNSETQWFPLDFRDLPDLHLCSWDRRVAPRCSSSAAPAEVPQLTTIWRIHEGSMKDPRSIDPSIHLQIFEIWRFHEISRDLRGIFCLSNSGLGETGWPCYQFHEARNASTDRNERRSTGGTLPSPKKGCFRSAMWNQCGSQIFFDITGIHSWQKST